MEIKRKPLKFHLETIRTKKKIVEHGLEACLEILNSCDEKGNFPGSEIPDSILEHHGPSKVTQVLYRSEELRDETEEIYPYVTLTFKEYVAIGKPEVITETRSYKILNN